MGPKKDNSSGENETRGRSNSKQKIRNDGATSSSPPKAKTKDEAAQVQSQRAHDRTIARRSDDEFDWWDALQAGLFASVLMFAILLGSYYMLRQYGYTQDAEAWIVDQVDRVFYPEDYARRMFNQRQQESYNRQRYQQQQQQDSFNRQWGGGRQKVREEEEEEERHEEEHGGRGQGERGAGREQGECVYECPRTRVCALNPRDCPCPGTFQTKCWTGDWYVCLEAPRKCAELA